MRADLSDDHHPAQRREPSVQTYARIAGVLFLLTILAGGFGEYYVPSKLIVSTDAAILTSPAMATELAPEAQAVAHLDLVWRSNQVPGISAAIASHGRIVFSQGVGFADLDNMVPATANTVYNIGSISKANTAVAVMQLVEQGKVGLDDAIQKYVPSFPDKGYKITIKDLMTHRSGIRHYRDSDFAGTPGDENMKPYASLEEAIKLFKDDPLLYKPGEYSSYSSYAVNLLQGVIETAAGMPFEDTACVGSGGDAE